MKHSNRTWKDKALIGMWVGAFATILGMFKLLKKMETVAGRKRSPVTGRDQSEKPHNSQGE